MRASVPSAEGESHFTHHEPCAACGSSDALARYSDGHGVCFKCGAYEPSVGGPAEPRTRTRSTKVSDLMTGEVKGLASRGINEKTCEKWGYKVGTYTGPDEEFRGQRCQIAPLYKDGKVVAQKLRFAGKKFKVVGDAKDLPLYGQHLWRDGGKMVVVTEGEIDALSVSQLQNNKWPVVSIPIGSNAAAKSVGTNLDFLMGFEKVVFMLDNDEAGIKAAHEAAAVLPPGKAYIASLPLKDANDMLKAGRGAEVIDAIWGAKAWRPDGIVNAADLWDLIEDDTPTQTWDYPWAFMNEDDNGLRKRELVVLTAGSGTGKSQVCREIAHHLIKSGERVGYVALEEGLKKSVLGLMSIEANMILKKKSNKVPKDERLRLFNAVTAGDSLYLYDHFGSVDSENLLSRLRYLAKGVGCGWIVLDHISIVVSGMDDGDERRLIDNLMTKLRSLVEETGVGLLLVSHLKRPQGNKGHEEGAITSLGQLRGSHSIAQLADVVLGYERDQQDPEFKDVMTVRRLKDREDGETGVVGYLKYVRETGRLIETTEPVRKKAAGRGPPHTEEEEF